MRRSRADDGQTATEYLGVLLLVAVIVGAFAMSGTGTAIASNTGRLICRISGGDCDGTPPPPAGPSDSPSGPVLTDQPLPVLPFPGSVSVTCTYSRQSEEACQAAKGSGVSVGAKGKLEIKRTRTTLNKDGCPLQTLSVAGTLELQATGKAKGARAGGSLEAHLGKTTKYAVTVPPAAADAIEGGGRPAPNPVDPITIGPGQGIQLSEEYYAGLGLRSNYRALQLQLGYDRGRKVSSGVLRVSPTTVRVMVGDEDFVRNALKVGLGIDGASISIGATEQLSSGTLHAIDIDMSTPEGWAAYQAFLGSGRLPASGGAGTTDPTSADAINYTDETKLEAQIGDLTVGGVLGDSEGRVTRTKHTDGSVDSVTTARYNGSGLAITRKQDANGNTIGDPTYSLLLHGVDGSLLDGWGQLDGAPGPAGKDGNLRLDFTPSELQVVKTMALNELADRIGVGPTDRPSPEAIERSLADGDGVIEIGGVQYAMDPGLTMLGAARTPEDLLVALYTQGVGGDANSTLDQLIHLATAQGDPGKGGFPGSVFAPKCG